MPHYLSNTKFDNELLCTMAANMSGQDVRFEHGLVPDLPRAKHARERMSKTHGCIVGYENQFNYSAFWEAWRDIQAMFPNLKAI